MRLELLQVILYLLGRSSPVTVQVKVLSLMSLGQMLHLRLEHKLVFLGLRSVVELQGLGVLGPDWEVVLRFVSEVDLIGVVRKLVISFCVVF